MADAQMISNSLKMLVKEKLPRHLRKKCDNKYEDPCLSWSTKWARDVMVSKINLDWLKKKKKLEKK